MIDMRRALTAGVTLAVAFGTGYIMQNSSSATARMPVPAIAPKAAPAEKPKSQIKAGLDLPADMRVPRLATDDLVIQTRRTAALDVGIDAPVLTDAPTPSPF